MRAAAAKADTAAPAELEVAEPTVPESQPCDLEPGERWHSWMEDYERTELQAICEGCGKTSRLWVCECGLRLCSGHCMGMCSNCGGEPWESTDSETDTLSEEYEEY